jgi:PIN domain nuclease of toxin-antitoxin system
MADVVLDASAVLAFLRVESGADIVEQVIPGALLSAVNLAEVARKFAERGENETVIRRMLAQLTCQIVDFQSEDAIRAGLFRMATHKAGLSLADCVCLTLAQRFGLPAVTADRKWASLDLGLEVVLIR